MPLNASDSSATNIRTPSGDDENSNSEGETGLQDIDRPVGFTRHRLHHVNAKGEQDSAEEDGHHNCRGDDVVVEDIQPAEAI